MKSPIKWLSPHGVQRSTASVRRQTALVGDSSASPRLLHWRLTAYSRLQLSCAVCGLCGIPIPACTTCSYSNMEKYSGVYIKPSWLHAMESYAQLSRVVRATQVRVS
jgi:hypothetical protein